MHEHTLAIVVVAGRDHARSRLELRSVLDRQLDDDWHAKDRIIKSANLACEQVNLADETLDSGALVGNDFEVRAEGVDVEHVELALEVLRIVPLDHGVLHHADSAQIAVDLHDSVWMQVVPVLVVVEYSFASRLAHLGTEPLDALEVDQSLHAKEVHRNFNDIALANLHNRLNQWSLLYATLNLTRPAQVVTVTFIKWRLVLSLVAVYPNEALLGLAENVELVRGHVLAATPRLQLVGEVCGEAAIQVL